MDDFKLAGKAENITPMWKEMGKLINLDPPTDFHKSVYLGCGQQDIPAPPLMIREKQTQYIQNFATGEEQKSPPNPLPPDQIKAWEYGMTGHAEQCVERYLELAKVPLSNLTKVSTPCIDDHALNPTDFDSKGHLSHYAAKIVLKILYLARMGRADLLWSVNTLAREVTKWTVACDKRLHRLVSYIHHTKHYTQICFIGDTPDKLRLVLFVDASFATDITDSKSTTGAFLVLMGPNSFLPITWMCKKQGAVSHSSTEAEIVALDAAIRMEGIPCLDLLTHIQTIMTPQKIIRKNKRKLIRHYQL